MFDINKYKNKKCTILGAGKSSFAVASLIADKVNKILISTQDFKVKPDENLKKNIEIEVGHSKKALSCSFVIKSPGIRHSAKIIKDIKAKNIPIFSELEVGLSFIPKKTKVIAITGTNGKTTTCSLLYKILKDNIANDKTNIWLAGNIGIPISEIAKKIKANDIVVLEVSSFQLEDSLFFKPNIAVILNVEKDHLSHHGTFAKYKKAKEKIFRYQDKNDVLIINSNDIVSVQASQYNSAKLIAFTTVINMFIKSDVFFDGDSINFACGDSIVPPREFFGIHNIENAMTAGLIAQCFGLNQKQIQKSFNSFKSLPHRIEFFHKYNGISFYNDSKATNIASVITALKFFHKKKDILLLLGGEKSKKDFMPLKPYFNNVGKILTFGDMGKEIQKQLNLASKVKYCPTLLDALHQIKNINNNNKYKSILLSPACASFDEFKNYQDRGNKFKKAVKAIFKTKSKKSKN